MEPIRWAVVLVAVMAMNAGNLSATIEFEQTGSSRCPAGSKYDYSSDFNVWDVNGTEKKLMGWYYIHCDGSEVYVPNQARTKGRDVQPTASTPVLSQRVVSTFRSVYPAAVRMARSRHTMATISILSDEEAQAAKANAGAPRLPAVR